MCVGVTVHVCGGQRTTCESCLSPSTIGSPDQAQVVRIGGSTFPCGALSMAPELQSLSMGNRKTKGVLLGFCQFDTNCSHLGIGNLK